MHQHCVGSLVELLESCISLEVAKIQLMEEEIRIAESGEAVDAGPGSVGALRCRKIRGQNEIRKYECLLEHLIQNPTPSRMKFVYENLDFVPS